MKKHGQQEIVGFVLIILIVTIIGLVFLSFSLGKQEPNSSSSEISNLLESSMYYTTSCAVSYIPQYKEMQDLIKECYKDKSGGLSTCLDERNVCDVLDSELKKVITNSLDISEDGVNKAYKLRIYFKSVEKEENILLHDEGNFNNCKSIVGGNHIIAISGLSSWTINIELEVCKN